jgi:nucleotide-binding universal stress UspA family protein
MQVTRILVPTDFSENADHALQYALAFAREFGAKLHLLHVVYFPAYTSARTLRLPRDAVSQVLAGLVKDARQRLKMLVEKTKEPEIILPPVVRVGVDYSEIAAFAAKEKVDLIVMGTHGRTGLAHAFLGSVAERVVRGAPCPVLTVRLPGTRGRKTAKWEWGSRSDVRHW